MQLRKMKKNERTIIYKMMFEQWGYNKNYEDFELENKCEEEIGERYVYLDKNKIVGTLIIFPIEIIIKKPLYGFGIGSVNIEKKQRNKGYGTIMMENLIDLLEKKEKANFICLYSEIDIYFYEKLGFLKIPSYLQHYRDLPMLMKCNEQIYKKISNVNKDKIPNKYWI